MNKIVVLKLFIILNIFMGLSYASCRGGELTFESVRSKIDRIKQSYPNVSGQDNSRRFERFQAEYKRPRCATNPDDRDLAELNRQLDQFIGWLAFENQ